MPSRQRRGDINRDRDDGNNGGKGKHTAGVGVGVGACVGVGVGTGVEEDVIGVILISPIYIVHWLWHWCCRS
jgi:hypothetical protein